MARLFAILCYMCLIFLLYFCDFSSAKHLKRGDACHNNDKNKPGLCVELKECSEALLGIQQNVLPQICGFEGQLPIVCCVNNAQTMKKPLSGEISKKKCEEYGQLVYKQVEVPIFSAGGKPVFINESQCPFTPTFVHGGENAAPKEFPHMALLGYGNKNHIIWGCGGSLISEQFVLTAAHCLSERQLGLVQWVRLGDLDYIKTDDDSAPQELAIAQTFRHEGYKRPARYNDIALLKLEKPVIFTDYVRPACLHTTFEVPKDKYLVTGWGHLAHDKKYLSDILQKALVDEFSIDECNVKYQPYVSKTKLRFGILPESQICAGGKTHDRDTCQGDSGGPLEIYNQQVHCMYSIVGVTSFGQAVCGVTGIPAIYTRVSNYIDWIEKIVWP